MKAQVVSTDSWQRIAENLVECVTVVAINIFWELHHFFIFYMSVFQGLVPLGHKIEDLNFRIHSYLAGFPRESAPLESLQTKMSAPQ